MLSERTNMLAENKQFNTQIITVKFMTKLRKNISQFALLYVAGAGVLVFLILSFIRKRAEKADTSQIVNPIVKSTRRQGVPGDDVIYSDEILELSGLRKTRLYALAGAGDLGQAQTFTLLTNQGPGRKYYKLSKIIEVCEQLGVKPPTKEALIELRTRSLKNE